MVLNVKLVDIDGPKVTTLSRARIDKAIASAARKLSRYDGELAVHVKRYDQDGKRTKYSVSARIVADGVRAKSESSSWTLITAVSQSLDELLAQVKGSADRTKTLTEKRRRNAKRNLG